MEPWQLLRDAGSARAFFAQVRRAVKDMEEWRYIADEGADAFAVTGTGGASSAVSDPTANRAIWLADHDEAIRANAVEHILHCESLIGAGLAIIAVVRRELGDKYAAVLDGYYIDCWSWASVADECGISKSTAFERRDIALDWLDSAPLLTFSDR